MPTRTPTAPQTAAAQQLTVSLALKRHTHTQMRMHLKHAHYTLTSCFRQRHAALINICGRNTPAATEHSCQVHHPGYATSLSTPKHTHFSQTLRYAPINLGTETTNEGVLRGINHSDG